MSVNGSGLLGIRWQLRSVVLDGRPIDNVAEAGAHIILGVDGRASGRGGCNLFFAGYKLKNNVLRFGAVTSTKKYCEATMRVEDAFFRALSEVTKLSAEDDVLKMASKNGRTKLTFVRAQPDQQDHDVIPSI